MIARIWRGWAPQATAEDYRRHYETEVTGHLQRVDGFRGARLLRQDDGRERWVTGWNVGLTTHRPTGQVPGWLPPVAAFSALTGATAPPAA
jgi:hypothetical protein